MRWILPLLLLASNAALSASTNLLTVGPSGGSGAWVLKNTVGYSFTVGKHPLKVTRIGIYNWGNSSQLNADVKAGLWTDDGTLIASATIPSYQPISDANFWWVDLAESVTLQRYATYRVGTQSSFAAYWPDQASPPSNVVSPAVVINGQVSGGHQSGVNGLVFPNNLGSGWIAGPNLTFEVLPYDTTPPVITLNGANPQTVFRGTTFNDLGATVTDDFDATRTITGSGTVDTSTVGSYTLTYSAQDEVGNVATPVTRTVNVVLNPTGDEDNDGLNNTEEATLGTNPYLRDTDSDGVNDLREVGDGSDPLDPASFNSLNLGLVAYYPLNGNANDASGNGFHGTNYGGVANEDRNGIADSSLQFNGVDAYTEYPKFGLSGARTFSGWVKFDEGQQWEAVILGQMQIGSSPPHERWHFTADARSFVVFYHQKDYVDNGIFGLVTSPAGTTWHHYVAVVDPDTAGSLKVTLFVDGKEIGKVSNRAPEELDAPYQSMRLLGGNAATDIFYYQGSLDDLRVYDRALTSSEVASLYAEERYEGFGLEGAASKSPFDPATAANWSAGGDEWTVDTATTHDGVDSVKAQTTDGQSTYREYTVTGPAVVDFWWKVSSEQLYDTFSYSLNGVNQETISGEVDWTYRTPTLPEGAHTIRWTYTKDVSDAVGQDAGWLDDFAVYPATATLRVRDGATVLSGTTTVDFGSADLGSAGFTKTLTFANEGYVPLEVQLSLPQGSPYTFDGGAATYGLLIGRGESVGVPITLATTAVGTKSAQLTISAPDSTTAPPSITLTGYVRGPDIGLAQGATTLTSGQTFDMGLAPRTFEFTIRNNGNVGDLVISGISATGNFQITQQPATTIPPQGSTTFKVLAKSIASGAQTGSVSITSNAANLATFDLPLSAKSFLGVGDSVEDSSVVTSGAGGASGWDFAVTTLPDGTTGNALKTGATPHSGQSHLEARFTHRGLLSWKWKVSTQEGFDWLDCGIVSPPKYADIVGDIQGSDALDIVGVEVEETALELALTVTFNGDITFQAFDEIRIGIANGQTPNTSTAPFLGAEIGFSSPIGGLTHWISYKLSSTEPNNALWWWYTNNGWTGQGGLVAVSKTSGATSTVKLTFSKSLLNHTSDDGFFFDVYTVDVYPQNNNSPRKEYIVDALSGSEAINPNAQSYLSSLATGISSYPRGGQIVAISTKSAIWREQTVYVPANGIVKWTYRKDGSAAVSEDAGYIADLSFQPFTTPQTTYGDWWASFGRPTPPAPKTPMAMSGLPAIMSWIGGFNPDTVPHGDLYRQLLEGGQPKFRFPISKRYSGGSVSAEFTSNLTNNWSGAGVSQTLHSQDADTVIIEATPPAGTTKGFMRLNVR